MENCLFIGNGLNRTLEGSSWNEVMDIISSTIGEPTVRGISFPLDFERMMNEYFVHHPTKKNRDNEFSKIKSKVADSVKTLNLTPDAVHYALTNVPFNSIITTNYDTLLESVFDPSYKPDETKKTYLDQSTALLKGKSFYHAHGVVGSTKSICLGFDHYVKLLKHIVGDVDKHIRYLLETEKSGEKWFYKFYTDNIYIIGFGLPDCELDIWGLITRRATLFYRDKNGFQDLIKNSISYYEIENDLDDLIDDRIIAKCALLRGEYVDVYEEKLSAYISKDDRNRYNNSDELTKANIVNAGYIAAYKAILKKITDTINTL